MSFTGNILLSWREPQTVMRRLLSGGTREDRALIYLMGGCFVIFMAQWPRLARKAYYDDEVPLQAMLGGALLGWLFIMPLVLYGIAALVRVVMVALRRPISWYEARLALFWALLAASPLWLLNGFLNGVIGPGIITGIIGLGLLGAFLWLTGKLLAATALEARAARA